MTKTIYIGEDREYATKQYFNLKENGWNVRAYNMNGTWIVSIKE